MHTIEIFDNDFNKLTKLSQNLDIPINECIRLVIERKIYLPLSLTKRGGVWQYNRFKALERDNFQCISCGERKAARLAVHHIDNSASINHVGEPNHTLKNLITLCKKCHYRQHQQDNKQKTASGVNKPIIKFQDFEYDEEEGI